jgi:hypothetical protein
MYDQSLRLDGFTNDQPQRFHTIRASRAQLALDRAIETRSVTLRALALARTGEHLGEQHQRVETALESWFSAIEGR